MELGECVQKSKNTGENVRIALVKPGNEMSNTGKRLTALRYCIFALVYWTGFFSRKRS